MNLDRTFINTWQDERVVTAVKATKRKKLVIASLWTEMCLAMPAIQAQGEGFEVLLEHGGATVVAYAWELQLLAGNKQPGF